MRLLALFAMVLCASAGAERQQLFNGRDLNGWKMTGQGRFEVENGLLKTVGGMGLLYYTREEFGDCTIRVVFRTQSERSNSGVFIRVPEQPADPWYAVHNGYEVQIDAGDDEWHATGAVYSMAKVTAHPQRPPGQWNTLDIVLDGDSTRAILNGTEVLEFDPSDPVPPRMHWYEPIRGPRPREGYIGLQNHDDNSVVYFREVSVERH